MIVAVLFKNLGHQKESFGKRWGIIFLRKDVLFKIRNCLKGFGHQKFLKRQENGKKKRKDKGKNGKRKKSIEKRKKEEKREKKEEKLKEQKKILKN